MNVLMTINGVSIRQDSSGRFCLNDLHKAAGGLPKDQPAYYFRSQGTKALIIELESSSAAPQNCPVSSAAGQYGGTYAVKELVYAYAMWISPKFHLQVIRTFDAVATGRMQPAAPAVPALPGNYKEALLALVAAEEEREKTAVVVKQLTHAVEVAKPKAAVFDAVIAGKHMTLTEFARKLRGVNLPKIKDSLLQRGYLWRTQSGKLHVRTEYRDVLFSEVILSNGMNDIALLPAGKVELVQLYNNGQLIMCAGRTPVITSTDL